MNYKNILITGGAGFVGSNLAISFKKQFPKITVIALDNLYRRGSELSVDRLKENGVKFVHGDIRNKEDLNLSVDLIIECSAEPSFKAGADGNTSYLIDTNLIGAINCFDLAKKNKADIIFMSTSRVYPIEKINTALFEEEQTRFTLKNKQLTKGISENGVNEDLSMEGIRSLYGSTKYCSEIILNEYEFAFETRSIINRFGTIAGPWQMGKVDQGIVTYWLTSHVLKRDLKYFGFGGNGKQVRDVIYIDDVFNLLLKQLEKMDDLSGKTFNVGGGIKNSISLNELTTLCQRITGNQVDIKKIPLTSEWDLKTYISDNQKIMDHVNWQPKILVEKTVSNIYKWMIDNPEVIHFFEKSL